MPQTYLGAAASRGRAVGGLALRARSAVPERARDRRRRDHAPGAAIIEQVSRAIEFVFLFTLLGGLLVLQAAIAATQDERRFDAAILRTLGASRAQLSAAQVAEFLVLGALAGLLAAARRTGDRIRALGSRFPDPVLRESDGLAARNRRRRADGDRSPVGSARAG
jgi:hypothetical protein